MWNHGDRVLLHILPVQALGGDINMHEVGRVAPWLAKPVSAADSGCSKESIHIVVALDSIRPRAHFRSTRGAQALSSQASLLSSQTSPSPCASGLGENQGDSDSTGYSSVSLDPTCAVLQVDCDSGVAKTCRHLTLFESSVPPLPRRGGSRKLAHGRNVGATVASVGDDVEAHREWQPAAARCSSVACSSRHVVAGMISGTVAIWSIGSARLIALLAGGAAGAGLSQVPDSPSCASEQAVAGNGGGGKKKMPGVTCVALDPALRIVASGRSDGFVDVWTCAD